MQNFCLYPNLTETLLESCGFSNITYKFSYNYQENKYPLEAEGDKIVRLSDPNEIWKIENEGLVVETTIKIAYPDLLYGANGIACHGAKIGVYIIYINDKLSQTGFIMPIQDESTPEGRTVKFHHTFPPGQITGDLRLIPTLFLETPATVVSEGEEHLINEAGVYLGEISKLVIDLQHIYMDFPIEEVHINDEVLWWVEFSEWEDPKTIDKFTKDNICLYLNTAHKNCPMMDGKIKNLDLLVEILSMTYLMIFQRLSQEDLKYTKCDIGLEEYSICSVLHQFIAEASEELIFEVPQKLLKGLKREIRRRLVPEGDET